MVKLTMTLIIIFTLFSTNYIVMAELVDCPAGQFYDKVTRRCCPCTDICLNKEMQQTEEDCEDLCPGFSPSTVTVETENSRSDVVDYKYVVLAVVGLCVLVLLLACIIMMMIKYQLFGRFIYPWITSFCKRQNNERHAVQPAENGGTYQTITSHDNNERTISQPVQRDDQPTVAVARALADDPANRDVGALAGEPLVNDVEERDGLAEDGADADQTLLKESKF